MKFKFSQCEGVWLLSSQFHDTQLPQFQQLAANFSATSLDQKSVYVTCNITLFCWQPLPPTSLLIPSSTLLCWSVIREQFPLIKTLFRISSPAKLSTDTLAARKALHEAYTWGVGVCLPVSTLLLVHHRSVSVKLIYINAFYSNSTSVKEACTCAMLSNLILVRSIR